MAPNDAMPFDVAINEPLIGHSQPLQEAWGDVVPFTDFPQHDWGDSGGLTGGGIIPITNISDRADGKFYPVFENEIDLAYIRGTARRLMSLTPFMPSAIAALGFYTMGNGPTVKAVGKNQHAKPDEWTKLLQTVLDRAIEQIDLAPLLEELDARGREEGEALAVLHQMDADAVSTEIVEMDCLTQPVGSTELEDWICSECGIDFDSFVPSWSFGVLTPKRRTNCPLGYHLVYDGSGADFDFYPTSRVVHLRRNVPANVKRGVSDCLQIFADLRHEAKISNNAGHTSGIRSAVAWVEEYPAGTTQAQGSAVGPSDVLNRLPTNIGQGGGTRDVKTSRYLPGSILRTSSGRKYQPGPMGDEKNGNLEIINQILLRRIGIRWNMPEYLISGDASNANMASTFVAESPFVKARERDQEFMRRVAKGLLWKAAAMIWTGITGKPLEVLEQIKLRYEIKVDFPAVQSRDTLAMTTALAAQADKGWVSDQTAMTELGRDPDQEIAQGAKKQAPPSPFGGGMFGQPQEQQGQQGSASDQPRHQPPQGQQPDEPSASGVTESENSELTEAFDESKHPRGDNGRFISAATLQVAKDDPEFAKSLRKKVTDPKERAKLDAVIGKHYDSHEGHPALADGAKDRRREVIKARVERGEKISPALTAEFGGEDWLKPKAETKPAAKPGVPADHVATKTLPPQDFPEDQVRAVSNRFNRGDVQGALSVTTKASLESGEPRFLYGTRNGFQISKTRPTDLPGGHSYTEIEYRDGKVHGTEYRVGGPSALDTLKSAASVAGKAVSAVASIPSTLAHAIDDMGTASVANAAKVEAALHGTGASGGNIPSLESHAQAVSKKLDTKTKSAIKYYSEDIGYDINQDIRDGNELTGEAHQVASLMSRAIQKHGALPAPVTVFRAMSWSHPEHLQEFLSTVKPGEPLQLKGFTSTSTDKNFVLDAFGQRPGGKVLMEITANRGLYLDSDELTHHVGQKELLMDNNSRFKVRKTENRDGVHVIHLEQTA